MSYGFCLYTLETFPRFIFEGNYKRREDVIYDEVTGKAFWSLTEDST